MFRAFLCLVLATLKQEQRYFPFEKWNDIEWNPELWTHNIFRVYQWFFGAPLKPRPSVSWDADFAWLPDKKKHVLRSLSLDFYTIEAFLAHWEGQFRSAFKLVPIRVQILRQVAVSPNGIQAPWGVYLSVAYDTSGIQATASTGPSISLTISGSDRMMISFPYYNTNTDGVTASTWNTSESLSKDQTTHPSFNVYGYLWHLAAPTTGTHNLTASAGASNCRLIGAHYTGSATTLDNSTQATQDNTTTITCSITTNVANTIIVAGTINNTGDPNSSSDGNVRQHNGAGFGLIDKACASAGANSVANSGTGFGATTDWGYVIASIKPPTVAVPTNPAILLLFT